MFYDFFHILGSMAFETMAKKPFFLGTFTTTTTNTTTPEKIMHSHFYIRYRCKIFIWINYIGHAKFHFFFVWRLNKNEHGVFNKQTNKQTWLTLISICIYYIYITNIWLFFFHLFLIPNGKKKKKIFTHLWSIFGQSSSS